MESLISQLLKSPKLNLYMERIQALLDEEYRKRMDFYKLIAELPTVHPQHEKSALPQPAEFINGEIVYRTPGLHKHTEAQERIYQLIKLHADLHHLGHTTTDNILISLTRNDYRPDLCFFGNEKSRFFDHKSLRWPAPDLVVEVVSDETDRVDRSMKFEDYEAHAIPEYWIVNPEAEMLEQYVLENKKYDLLTKSGSGMVKSYVLTDFEIPIQAIFKENLNFIVANKMLKQ